MQKCVGMMKGETNTSGGHKYLRVCRNICALHGHATAHVSALHKCVCTRKTNKRTQQQHRPRKGARGNKSMAGAAAL